VAPSACNNQPLRFIVVTERAELDELAGAYPRDWFRGAPAVIVVCSDHQKSFHRADGKDHADLDAAIAADHMTLAAAERGLGTCWICAFDVARVRRQLDLPDHLEPVILLPIGHPEEPLSVAAHRSPRQPLENLVQWGATPPRR
jgi:nitroreductase